MSYTETAAVLGDGTTFSYCATEGGDYVAYGELKKISLPKKSVAKVKATNMESLDATHEYIPGFIEPGEYSLDMNFTAATWIQACEDLRKKQFFQISIPDGSGTSTSGVLAQCQLQGWISEVGGDVPVEEIISATIKIQVTGSEAWTAG